MNLRERDSSEDDIEVHCDWQPAMTDLMAVNEGSRRRPASWMRCSWVGGSSERSVRGKKDELERGQSPRLRSPQVREPESTAAQAHNNRKD